MNAPRPVSPFYFGSPDKPLFGCYHAPRPGPEGKCVVVICQPIGHEYINCHRALRQLAVRLSDSGFPVLRFDYFGCGDSSGSTEEGGLLRWVEDISIAITEARHRAAMAQVCLVGLRLGAALSLIAAAGQGDIESLVLWDPVVTGKEYLRELLSVQRELLQSRPKPAKIDNSQHRMEIVGFPLSRFLYGELEKLNLLEITVKPAENILVIQSQPRVGETEWRAHLGQSNSSFEYQHIDAPQTWLPTVDGSLLVPNRILQSVVSWTCGKHS